MRHIYIAAEKLVYWDTSGEIKVDHALTETLAQMPDTAYTLYFVPERYGLCFEDGTESAQAWSYFERALERESALKFRVLCFEDAIDTATFRTDMQQYTASQQLIFSSDEADDDLSQALNLRKIEAIPMSASDASLRHTMRAILNAALHF